MTVKYKRFQNTKTAIKYLEDLAFIENKTFLFRGHSDEKYKLINTWQQHRSIPHQSWMSDIDEALEKYTVGLEKIGVMAHNHLDRFEALEHGRHHGVPTPCLDFSYSPYVALFFAFNGVRIDYSSKQNKYSVIYALDVDQLALEWAKYIQRHGDKDKITDVFWSVKNHNKDLFEHGFPAGVLQFIPFPGKNNTRMQKQLGALLYDTINYDHLDANNLEEFIDKMVETPVFDGNKNEPGDPILHKILINQKCTGQVFQKLELMNMTGGTLYGDADGVALDIKNAYNYNPKFSYLRDVESPELDDTKM